MRRTALFAGLTAIPVLCLLIIEWIKSESSKELAIGFLELALVLLGAVVADQVLLTLRESRRRRTADVSDHAASPEVSDLAPKVLRLIETGKLSPRPYAYFLAKHLIFAALAGASIVLSGVCFAVAMFALHDIIAIDGRDIAGVPLDDLFQALPVVWLCSFILFIVIALVGAFHTKRGYRYALLDASSVALSAGMGLGLLLHSLDAGRRTHNLLAMRFPTYERLTDISYGSWQKPDQGYLGGEVLSVDAGRSLRLRDFDGQEWRVDISSAVIAVADPLVEEGDIAVNGERKGALAFKAKVINAFN